MANDPVATAKQVGIDVCDALGIPFERVRAITLSITAGEPATVVVERFVSMSESAELKEALEQYTVQREQG